MTGFVSTSKEIMNEESGSERSDSSARLGPSPVPSPANSGTIWPMFGLKDTTPRRAPSIVVENINDLIGIPELNEGQLNKESGDYLYDCDNSESDEEESVDDDDDYIDTGDKANAHVEKLGLQVAELKLTQNTICDILNQHSGYLYSIHETLRGKAGDDDGFRRSIIGTYVRSKLNAICDSFTVFTYLREVYLAMGEIPFLGPALQLVYLANLVCIVTLLVPSSISQTFFIPIWNGSLFICSYIFTPLKMMIMHNKTISNSMAGIIGMIQATIAKLIQEQKEQICGYVQ